jgi:hypothetical protein
MSGHCFKLHFCMLEKSQGNHHNLDCHNFFRTFPLITNFTNSKFDTNKKCFCMFKTLKPQKWIDPFFSNIFFLFVLKIEMDFNIDD